MKDIVKLKREKRISRHKRVRAKIFGTKTRPRLAVFKGHKNTYLQLIDDNTGSTLVAASTVEVTGVKGKMKKTQKAAHLLASRTLKLGIKKAVFDRGGYKYHGRVKAVAETMRESGIKI